MYYFKDEQGNTWDVTVTVHGLKRIRGTAGHDLLEPKELQAVTGDLIQTVDCMWALCLPQCEERKVTDEDFGKLVQPVFESAVDAFFEALAFFFRQCGKTVLAQLIEMSRRASREVHEKATEQLADEKVNQAIAAVMARGEAQIETELQRLISGNTSTDSPGLSESTQAP